MFGIVIDKETKFVIEECVIVNDYEPKENEEVMPYDYDLGNPVCNMNKPQYIDGQWVDTQPLPPQEPIEPQPDKIEVLQNELKQAQKTIADLEVELLLSK